jgi:hypothetical protein
MKGMVLLICTNCGALRVLIKEVGRPHHSSSCQNLSLLVLVLEQPMYVQSLRKYATFSFPLLDFAVTLNKTDTLSGPETVLNLSLLKILLAFSCNKPLNTVNTTEFYCS